MLIDFTEYELETIANAMEDYIQYDDEKLDTELLFGGLSVADRVTSINNKIDNVLIVSDKTTEKNIKNCLSIFKKNKNVLKFPTLIRLYN